MREHYNYTHTEKKGREICEICGVEIKIRYMKIHMMNKHASEEEKRFHCQYCNKGFNEHGKLSRHETQVHEKRLDEM